MKNGWIREMFSFSTKERRGIIILILIIFLLILTGKVIPLFIHDDPTNFSKWESEVNAWLDKTEKPKLTEIALHPVTFDPNSIDSITLANMGLPLKVVANWVKYLGKGGRFRNKEEVKKIFGMTPVLFEQLDSFIVIGNNGAVALNKGRTSSRIKPSTAPVQDAPIRRNDIPAEKIALELLELNSADSAHLLQIRGIGTVLASRIIRYRNLLGGYYAINQLKEVYGLREENYSSVAPCLTVDPSAIKTLNINFSTVQDLGHHPYIGYRTARKVVKLRDKTGRFSTADELSSVIAADSLKKLIPYLKFGP